MEQLVDGRLSPILEEEQIREMSVEAIGVALNLTSLLTTATREVSVETRIAELEAEGFTLVRGAAHAQ